MREKLCASPKPKEIKVDQRLQRVKKGERQFREKKQAEARLYRIMEELGFYSKWRRTLFDVF